MTLIEPREVAFEVLRLLGGPLHPDQARLYVTRGRYNMALCDRSGAIIRTFIPDTSRIEDIIAALDARFYAVADEMGYACDPADV